MPSEQSKRTWEAYRSRLGKPAPRSSTPVRHRSSCPRPPPMIPRYTTPCSRALSPNRSNSYGAPGAVAGPRVLANKTGRPTLSLISKAGVAPVRTHASCQRRQCRRCIERAVQGGEGGRNDTSPTEMHDSPGNRTGGSSQEGMRALPGRKNTGSGSTKHVNRAMNCQMRLQCLARSCT